MAEWKGLPYGRDNPREAWLNERKRAKAVEEKLRVSRIWTVGPVDALFGQVCQVDTTAGAITVNLPPANGLTGHRVVVYNNSASANNMVITPRGTELINGAATMTLSSGYAVAQLLSIGDGWIRL